MIDVERDISLEPLARWAPLSIDPVGLFRIGGWTYTIAPSKNTFRCSATTPLPSYAELEVKKPPRVIAQDKS